MKNFLADGFKTSKEVQLRYSLERMSVRGLLNGLHNILIDPEADSGEESEKTEVGDDAYERTVDEREETGQ